MKKAFVVLGVMDSGSGTLTYPEDFDFIGFFETEKEAQDHADELNRENGIADFGERLSDDEGDEDGEDEDDEDEGGGFDGPTDETVYTVEEVKNLSKKGKKGR